MRRRKVDIRAITLGPMSPWPNRAETANRLFKKQVNLMLGSLHDGTAHSSLTDVTYRSLLKAAALARNSSVTYGGVTPLELAFGRRPTDLIQLDTALPSQLTPDFSKEELSAQQLRDLARKAYIEARQSDDVRRDLARQGMKREAALELRDSSDDLTCNKEHRKEVSLGRGSMRKALEVAEEDGSLNDAMDKLKDGFWAASTARARSSKRKEVRS